MDKITCIYKAENKILHKVYIGRTVDYARRIREHKSHAKKDGGDFHLDIIKYGFESFEFSILYTCDKDDLDRLEIETIKKYREVYGAENVYNICKGGIGGLTHDVSGENNPCFNRKRTAEEVENIRKKLIGRPKPKGFGDKVSQALKGKPKSPDAVAKRSIPVIAKNIKTGDTIYFKSQSEASRSLCCDAHYALVHHAITKNGFIIFRSEGVETIENTDIDV